MRNLFTTTILALSVSACAGGYAGKDYAPVVDVQATAAQKRVPEMEAHQQYQRDLAYCQGLAEQRSVFTAGGTEAVLGSVLGAGGGALAGVVSGGRAGMGALLGAGAGVLAGAAHGGIQGNQNKQDITINCLRGRGWNPLAR